MAAAFQSCKINLLLSEDNEAMGPSRRRKPCAAIAAAAVAAIVAAGWWMGAAAVSAAATKRPTWGQILILGTQSEGRHPFRFSAQLYDPASGRFAAHPALTKHERVDETATVIEVGVNAGKVLIAGGDDEEGSLFSTQLYDPATNRFTRGPNMSDNRGSHTATAITSGPNAGKILLVGGYAAEFYDPIANAFAPGPVLNGDRSSHTATTIQSGLNAGKVLVAGGLSLEDKRGLAWTELYDPRTNTFVLGPTMNVVRQNHTATVISSGPNAGKILLVGGIDFHKEDPSTVLASTELYDPAANAFAPGPAMHWRRAFHIAVAIASGPNAGKILIAGGFGGREGGKLDRKEAAALDSTELYDPATNTFAPGPAMHGAPGMAVVVQLPPAPPPR